MDMEKFKGVVVASPTPCDNKGNIDELGTRKLLNYYVNNKISGVFLLSSTGEYFTLTQEKREQIVNISIEEIGGKLPLMVMISDACLENVLTNIDNYGSKGVDAVVLTPPYYYRYSQNELYKFFISAADRSPVPLLLYNQPMRLPNNMEIALVKDLSQHGNIIGIKDTNSDAARLLELLNIFKDREDFLVYSGSERLAAYSALFGGNFVYALAVVNPRLFIEIFECGRKKDIERVMILQEKINNLLGLFDSVNKGSKDSFSNFTHSIKAALKLKGICEPYNSQLGFELSAKDYERVGRFI